MLIADEQHNKTCSKESSQEDYLRLYSHCIYIINNDLVCGFTSSRDDVVIVVNSSVLSIGDDDGDCKEDCNK